MLYGADSHIAFSYYCSAGSGNHILCHSVYDGLAVEIDTAYLISMIVGCGIKSGCKESACMKTFA